MSWQQEEQWLMAPPTYPALEHEIVDPSRSELLSSTMEIASMVEVCDSHGWRSSEFNSL